MNHRTFRNVENILVSEFQDQIIALSTESLSFEDKILYRLIASGATFGVVSEIFSIDHKRFEEISCYNDETLSYAKLLVQKIYRQGDIDKESCELEIDYSEIIAKTFGVSQSQVYAVLGE
ncbi:TPA: hypothetical protein ACGO2A_001142 [Streptococcus suis]